MLPKNLTERLTDQYVKGLTNILIIDVTIALFLAYHLENKHIIIIITIIIISITYRLTYIQTEGQLII